MVAGFTLYLVTIHILHGPKLFNKNTNISIKPRIFLNQAKSQIHEKVTPDRFIDDDSQDINYIKQNSKICIYKKFMLAITLIIQGRLD